MKEKKQIGTWQFEARDGNPQVTSGKAEDAKTKSPVGTWSAELANIEVARSNLQQ